jgi:hypothetical protein
MTPEEVLAPSFPGVEQTRSANAKPENRRRENTNTKGRQRETVRTKTSRAEPVFSNLLFTLSQIILSPKRKTPILFYRHGRFTTPDIV